MSELTAKLKSHFYRDDEHPYRTFEAAVQEVLKNGDTLLDAGCGRTAPVLMKYKGVAGRLVGVDLVEPRDVISDVEYYQADLANIPLPNCSVDVVISRSVFEHLTDPNAAYAEISRILKPSGLLIFLTANIGDYGTAVARLVPNKFHAKVVQAVEGRAEEDTFPTAYKTNSRKAVDKLSSGSGFSVRRFEYLNQYPNYFMFNPALFLLGVAYERLTSRFEILRSFRGWILVTLEKK